MKRIFSLAVSIALSVSLFAAVPVVSYADEAQPPAATTESDPNDPGTPTDPTDPSSDNTSDTQKPDECGISPCTIDSPNDWP